MESMVVGVDIGGSHITGAVIDTVSRKSEAGSWRREAVEATGTAEDILDSWVAVIEACFDSVGIAPTQVGIAMPGPFDYAAGISLMKDQGKYTSLYGVDVGAAIAQRLGIDASDIRFSNDAACFLQGELFSGTGVDIDRAIGLTLGTGFGSAYTGTQGVEDAALWCASFKTGIAEDYFSNRGLVRIYHDLSGRSIANAKELHERTTSDVFARKAFQQFGTELAEFLEPLVQQHSPQLLVIGGNISKAFGLFSPFLQEGLQHHELIIQETLLGENAALIGAASLLANPGVFVPQQ